MNEDEVKTHVDSTAKKTATVEESLAAIKKTLYQMNGTLMAEGELGQEVKSIGASMNKLTMELSLIHI